MMPTPVPPNNPSSRKPDPGEWPQHLAIRAISSRFQLQADPSQRPQHPKTQLTGRLNRLSPGATRPSVKLPDFFVPDVTGPRFVNSKRDFSSFQSVCGCPRGDNDRTPTNKHRPPPCPRRRRLAQASQPFPFQCGNNSARSPTNTSDFVPTNHAYG